MNDCVSEFLLPADDEGLLYIVVLPFCTDCLSDEGLAFEVTAEFLVVTVLLVTEAPDDFDATTLLLE